LGLSDAGKNEAVRGCPSASALLVVGTIGGSKMASQLVRPVMKEVECGCVIMVHFSGANVSLDGESLYRIQDQLFALADEPSTSDLLLDFGNVEYLTSETLGALVRLHRKLRARGRRLTVG